MICRPAMSPVGWKTVRQAVFLAIACGKGIILPAKIQRQGKKPMEIGEFLRGFSFPSGTVLK